jgi:hypothetical protein
MCSQVLNEGRWFWASVRFVHFPFSIWEGKRVWRVKICTSPVVVSRQFFSSLLLIALHCNCKDPQGYGGGVQGLSSKECRERSRVTRSLHEILGWAFCVHNSSAPVPCPFQLLLWAHSLNSWVSLAYIPLMWPLTWEVKDYLLFVAL